MSKRGVLQSSGKHAIELVFDDCGYTVVWDSKIPLTPIERAFFYSYPASRGNTALKLGFTKIRKNEVSRSVQTLALFVQEFLLIASKHNSVESLRSALFSTSALDLRIDAFEFTPGSQKQLLLMLCDSLLSVYGKMPLCDALQQISESMSFNIDICFNLSSGESAVSSTYEHPAMLTVSCTNNGIDSVLSKALLSTDNTEIMGKLRPLSHKSSIVSRIYNNGVIRDSIPLTYDDVRTFLTEAGLYAAYGIVCRIPNAWKRKRSNMSITLSPGKNSIMGHDTLTDFDLALCVDGSPLTEEEINTILLSRSDFLLFRGKWTRLNIKDLQRVINLCETIKHKHTKGLTLSEIIRTTLAPKDVLFGSALNSLETDVPVSVSFENNSWLKNAWKTLSSPRKTLGSYTPGVNLRATLRPYQKEGVAWLCFMHSLGLGACLADDMGLGKTVQAIALLEHLREAGAGPSLIIVPASLMSNWENELNRFAPKIRFCILHPMYAVMRSYLYSDTVNNDSGVNVYITTYTMATRLKSIYGFEWDCVILDEAQTIKNPATLQAKAIKMLKARFRLVLTGTPVENSSLDLWSVFGFLNPGFLGSARQFQLMADNGNHGAERVREMVRPFILRRTKTDKRIIRDLPEKIEITNYCHLTPMQSALYQSTVESFEQAIRNAAGMERRGMVLTTILSLKKICGHPDHFSGGGAFLPANSGKLTRLTELCSEIRDKNEKVLVFTQFREMCNPIATALHGVFGRPGVVLHGGTRVQSRGELIEQFNSPSSGVPFMVLSLRAGGLGFNLTSATQVVHYDRWWNPAVEDQATDRAFRIGQTKNVLVHKFLCRGTLEDKIEAVIEKKREFARVILDSPSNSLKLTELSDDELIELFRMEKQLPNED